VANPANIFIYNATEIKTMPRVIHPTAADVGKNMFYMCSDDEESLVELTKLEGEIAEFRMLGSDYLFTSEVTKLRLLRPDEDL
jgi:hypothetical protein